MTTPRTGRRSVRRIGLALLSVVVTVTAVVLVTRAEAQARIASHNPYGWLTSVEQVSARYFQVSGWAVDNDSNRSLQVAVLVDGHVVKRVAANHTTPAVPSRYGNHGPRHGYSTNIRVGYKRHTICVVGVNVGPGRAHRIGCRSRQLANNNPVGHLTRVVQIPGGLEYAGTAADPNSHTPTTVTITANGKLLGTPVTAGRGRRHDVFVGTQQLDAGTYNICATAKNIGLGHNAGIGCKQITLNYNPTGAITSLTQIPGGIQVSGWASDPDTSAPIQVRIVDTGTVLQTVTANGSGTTHNGHQFTEQYQLAPGAHTICTRGMNVDYGTDQKLACQRITLNYNPTASISSLSQTISGIDVAGLASDPDTTKPITVQLTLDGQAAGTATANGGPTGHGFAAALPAGDGKHTVCAVGVNVLYGTGNSTAACDTITLNYDPVGAFQSLTRSASDPTKLLVSGWALDQGTPDPVTVSATLDGAASTTGTADQATPATPSNYTAVYGADHGFSFTVPADAGEHTVCLTAVNIGDGQDTPLGCELIIAVNPKPPSAPQQASAVGGYGGATVSWTAPANDGGAPPSSYTVTSSPGNVTVTVPGAATTATVIGLKPKQSYTFTVVAKNVAGSSPAATTASVVTQASPPPQTSPAPVSTSRYIRNITGSSAADQATMRSEGATDAYYNPSGHGYLILLDIGGQDSYDGGVVLSATTRFVSYAALATDIKAYVDGYAAKQNPSAPVTIAIGTNNDMDVTKASGQDWANKVVDPVRSYVASKYPGITIAGANDIEPGFRGTYSSSRAWLTGYLGATPAPFVFNGSADGCSWSAPSRHCNNGWTMAALYQLAGGIAPTRILNLPQIYNTTMPRQWKYISLTGVNAGHPRINFGGPLTEWTACDQAGGCGSITGHYAWQQLWNQLQSDTHLKITSLPYSTDLRIDKP